MNYFELFEIPVQLKVDANALKSKFYNLSRKYHPDFHTQDSLEIQQEVLEKSSVLNKAWKTFQNPDETLKYVLQLKKLLEEEEKYALSPVFLMEVMEINEQLMEAKAEGDEPAMEKIRSTIEQFQHNIYAPVKNYIEGYSENTGSEEELLQVKTYYFKKKYLQRILDGLP